VKTTNLFSDVTGFCFFFYSENNQSLLLWRY